MRPGQLAWKYATEALAEIEEIAMENDPITIPTAALEAAEAEFLRGIASGDWDSEKITLAACLAMLKNWPGRKTENRDGWNWTDTGAVTTHRYEALILPLG
jgi:hypothetical protein